MIYYHCQALITEEGEQLSFDGVPMFPTSIHTVGLVFPHPTPLSGLLTQQRLLGTNLIRIQTIVYSMSYVQNSAMEEFKGIKIPSGNGNLIRQVFQHHFKKPVEFTNCYLQSDNREKLVKVISPKDIFPSYSGSTQKVIQFIA